MHYAASVDPQTPMKNRTLKTTSTFALENSFIMGKNNSSSSELVLAEQTIAICLL
jgi:hypothetical protein